MSPVLTQYVQPAHHAGRANAKDEAAFATGYPSLGLRLSRRLRRLQAPVKSKFCCHHTGIRRRTFWH